jgi:hypothetical protein
LDLENAYLELCFSVPILASSLDATQIRLLERGSAANPHSANPRIESFTFSATTRALIGKDEESVVKMKISTEDLNTIKSFSKLAKHAASTYMAISDKLGFSTGGLPIQAILPDVVGQCPMLVTQLTQDSCAAALVAWMWTSQNDGAEFIIDIKLIFSEPVDVDLIVWSKFQLLHEDMKVNLTSPNPTNISHDAGLQNVTARFVFLLNMGFSSFLLAGDLHLLLTVDSSAVTPQ